MSKVKNRPRPKGRHTFIALRYNERYNEHNNRNATCFAFSLKKQNKTKTKQNKKTKKKNKKQNKTAVMTPDVFRFFLLLSSQELHRKKYEYLSSLICKSYTSFSVGRWLRFFDVLVYRSSVQSILKPRNLILTSNYCYARKEI